MLLRERTSQVKFQLSNVDEPCVMLVIRDRRNGGSWTFPMASRGPGKWERTVELPEGRYEGRYYAGDEHRMTYYGRASAGTELGTKGLDGVFEVRSAAEDLPQDQAAPLRALLASMQLGRPLAAVG